MPVVCQRQNPVINHQILSIVLILIVSFVSHAINVQVTATGGSSGPGCGSTVSNACGSLTDAWSVCQSNSSEPCNMYLQPGRYAGTNNAALDFSTAVVSITGFDTSGATILDGEGIQHGFSGAGSFTLDGLVVQNYINSALTWNPTISYSLLEVSNCTFVGNQGSYGGALSLQPIASSVAAVVNASFIGNTVSRGGGAIYARAPTYSSTFTLKIGDHAQFVSNIAAVSGFEGGGAIYASGSADSSTITLMIGNNAQFVSNTVGDGKGSVIIADAYGSSATITLTIGDNAHFVDNTAGSNGAIYVSAVSLHSTITLMIGDNAQFMNNIAAVSGTSFGYGGAIYADATGRYATITLTIGDNGHFVNNIAAVSGPGYGGAICADATGRYATITLTIGNNGHFVNNTAAVSRTGYGGAIYAYVSGFASKITFTVADNAQFMNNTAAVSQIGYGGAIEAYGNGEYSTITLTIEDNAQFVGNIAAVSGNGQGGMIYALAPAHSSTITLTIGDYAQFVSNIAAESGNGRGGVIYAEAYGQPSFITLTLGDHAQFVNNTAAVSGEGGAMWALAQADTLFQLSIGKNASFFHNSAADGGIGFLSSSLSNRFAVAIGASAKFISDRESGFRVTISNSRESSFDIGENSTIENYRSFLSASLFQQSVFEINISDAASVNCENCITVESFDSSTMQLSIVNSRFAGIVNYALSVLGVSAGKLADSMHINIVSSSFVGTSGASAILGTASNAGNVSIRAVDCDFASFSSESDGGAIQLIAVADSTLDVGVQNCRFRNSSAGDETNGGSIASTCFSSQCSIEITNSSFESSTAALGGALAMLDDGGSTCTMSITNSTFKDCQATAGGGAIYSKRVATLTVISTSFVANTAAEGDTETSGGAIFVTGPSSLNIIRCNFNGNSASSGGAIAMSDSVTSVLEATTVSSNQATGNGGAIAVTDEGNHITVGEECILNGNYAKHSGGAVYVSGDSDGKRSLAHFLGVSCQDNSATMGGCIFTDENTNLTLDSTFSAAENHADYGSDVAATDWDNNGATLSSDPTYGAPHCLKHSTQSIEISPGLDASSLFYFEIVDVHGVTVQEVDTSFLIEIISEDSAMTIAGGSKTVDSVAGIIRFNDVAFTSTSLQASDVRFEVTPSFSPQCAEMPTLLVHFTECPATYYINEGTCVLCPDGQYQLTEGSNKCDDCGFGGTCLNGAMFATKGFWCETQDVYVDGTVRKSCDKKSRLYKCAGPGCLGGDPFQKPEEDSFAVACDEEHGYTGLLCAECKEGYVANGNKCSQCSLLPSTIIHALAALASIIVFIFFALFKAGYSNVLLTLTLFYFQNVILLPVSFEGLTLGLLGAILDKFSIPHAVLIPISMGLSLVMFCGSILSLGLPSIVRLLRRVDFKAFSSQQLVLAGISGNISLAALCMSVAIAVSLLPRDVRLVVLVLLLLVLLSLLAVVVIFLASIGILTLLRRPLPFADRKGISAVAVSVLGFGVTIFCSVWVAVYYLGIVDEIKNIPLLVPALQLSFPFLTFVLPVIANLDISAALLELTQTCATPWNYYVRFFVEVFNPVLLLGILWLFYPASLFVNWGLGILSEKTHPAAEKIREYIHERIDLKKFTVASLELLLINLTRFLSTAVGFFACRHLQGKGWFLNQENSIECYWNNPEWVLLAPLAFLGVMYAVVLLPTVYLGILAITRFQNEWLHLKWRIGLDDSKRPLVAFFEVMHWIAETFQFQLRSTHPQTFYWPVTIVLQRIFIVVVYVWLVQGDLQIAGAVILALFYLIFVLLRDAVNPFVMRNHNFLEVVVVVFLAVCAGLYVLVDISLLYNDTNDDIYYRGITDVIQFLFWPIASIPVLAAVVIWVINQSPKEAKEGAKDASEDNVVDNRSSTLGLSLSPQEHADPLKEALLVPGIEDEDESL
jgi:predicted outer membrane repeat protein